MMSGGARPDSKEPFRPSGRQIGGGIIAVLLLIFIVTNTDDAAVTLVVTTVTMPLWLVLAGTALLGVSKDPPKKHLKFIEKHALSAPLASDAAEGGLSDALGIWTEKQNYGRTYMGMVRSTYLVDAGGRIARVWSPVKVKGHAAEVLEAAQAL